MNQERSSRQGHQQIQFFTWMRGIAAFFVILSHSVLAAEAAYQNEKYTNSTVVSYFFSSIALGNFGVTLFFVLSGCTLFLMHYQTRGTSDVRSFYIKRFMRIYPAFAVSVLAYLLFRPVFQAWYNHPHAFWVERQFLASLNARILAEYFALIFNFTSEHTLINNAYWSLPVEFQFYLLFPLVLLANRAAPYVGPIVFCGVTYFVAHYYHVPGLTLERLWEFSAGMLIGYASLVKPFRISLRNSLVIMILCVAGAALVNVAHVLTLPGAPGNLYNGLLAITAVWAALACDYYTEGNRLTRFLDNYGEISYSTYLYHNLFVGMAVLACIQMGMTGSQKILFILPFVTVATFYAATFSHRLVEMPGIRLGKRLAKNKQIYVQPGG